MRIIISCIYLAILANLVKPPIALARVLEVGGSAVPKFREKPEVKFDYRVFVLRKFLSKHASPLTPYSLDFIKTADYYDLDWRMVPAISGVESTFGKRIPHRSYNAYGWANGKYRFKSWPDSITVVSKTLRKNYLDRGATNISKISKIYAPPSPTWGVKVKYFVKKISILPLSFDI